MMGPHSEAPPAQLAADRPSTAHSAVIATGTPAPPVQVQVASQRILVASDNFLNRMIIDRQLTRAGYVVEAASNGQKALEVLASGERFDCCFMEFCVTKS